MQHIAVEKGYEILSMPLLKLFLSDYGEGIGPSWLTWEMMTYSALIYQMQNCGPGWATCLESLVRSAYLKFTTL